MYSILNMYKCTYIVYVITQCMCIPHIYRTRSGSNWRRPNIRVPATARAYHEAHTSAATDTDSSTTTHTSSGHVCTHESARAQLSAECSPHFPGADGGTNDRRASRRLGPVQPANADAESAEPGIFRADAAVFLVAERGVAPAAHAAPSAAAPVPALPPAAAADAVQWVRRVQHGWLPTSVGTAYASASHRSEGRRRRRFGAVYSSWCSARWWTVYSSNDTLTPSTLWGRDWGKPLATSQTQSCYSHCSSQGIYRTMHVHFLCYAVCIIYMYMCVTCE